MKHLMLCMLSVFFLAVSAGIAHAQAPAEDDPLAAFQRSLPQNSGAVDGPNDALLPAASNPDPLGIGGTLPIGVSSVPGAMPASAAEMQAMMEEEAAEQRRKLEEQTFEAALKQLLPLKPEQIRRTLEEFEISREAAETPITVPEPRQVVQTVSLDTADTPAVIKLAPGYITTVTILDSTGSPWPIQDLGWAGKFEVAPPEEGGHIIRITPSAAHGMGNLSVRLVDLITPVVIQMQTGIDEVHYRFDARIPKPGPLAKTPLIEYGGLSAVAGRDDNLMAVLEGTAPSDAVKLMVDGADGRTSAWKVADKVYLRTPLTLLSPGWDSSVSSADGMTVYTINNAPVVLLSDNGRMVRANIAAEEVSP